LLQFMDASDSLNFVSTELGHDLKELQSTDLFTDLSLMKLQLAYDDYQYWYDSYFSKEIDYSQVRGQHNLSRFRKPESIRLCIDNETEIEDLALVYLVSKVLDVRLEIYYQGETVHQKLLDELHVSSHQVDSWVTISESIDSKSVYRVLNNVGLFLGFSIKFHQQAVHIYRKKPMCSGRVELLNYLSEQSISQNYHRYGNLMGLETSK